MSIDDIEEWVTQTARDDSVEAKLSLFRRLLAVEVFFATRTRFVDGGLVDTTALLRLQDGTHAMMLYTSASHPDVPEDFSGATVETALGLALKMPDADWVILSNLGSDWVALNRKQIATVLAGPGNAADSGDRLAGLISEAVATSPQQYTGALLAELAGRELFVDLAAGQSPHGQPMMSTYTVGGVSGVVRAFLTRQREGVKFGGVQWEALRDMIRATPTLGGVQVVNDADDWVLFDRQALAAVTYYATLHDGDSPENPAGIIRRIHTEPPLDEAFRRDMQWHPTEFLRRYELRGTHDVDYVQISQEDAEAVLNRWCTQWTGQA